MKIASLHKFGFTSLIGLVVIVAVIVFSATTIKMCSHYKSESERKGANVSALEEGITFYRTKDSLSAASVQVLTLSNAEFKRYNEDLVKEAQALKLQVKRLESASTTAMQTSKEFVTQWRDSIVYNDGRIDTVRCVEYSDEYMYFSGCAVDSGFLTSIFILDTLVQFVYRVPKKIWFIKFGVKAIRQEVVSKNPNTEIVFTEYIKLKRK